MHNLIETIRAFTLSAALASGDPTPGRLLNDEAFNCIAKTVYAEARGEGVDGMALVVQSIVNRHLIQGKSACRIVREAYDGWAVVKDKSPRSFEQQPWLTAKFVTVGIIGGHLSPGRCSEATHFLNPRAVRRMPNWARPDRKVCEVGRHVGYAISNI